MRVDRRAQRAIAGGAVQIGGDARFAFERSPGEKREAAQVAHHDMRAPMNFVGRQKTGILGVEIGRRKIKRVERRLAFQNRAAHVERELATDGLGEGGIGQRKALHRGLALEQDSGLLLRQRTVWTCAEGRLDLIDRPLLDTDLSSFERAVDRRGRKRPSDRCVEIEFADSCGAGNRARVDLEIKQAVRRPFAFKVEPRGGRHEMQAAGQGNARVVVELDVALKRRVAREDRLNDPWRKPLEARIQIERKPPPGALSRNDHLPVRPHVRACAEVELRGEIVQGARAIEGELDRRQAGEIGEMGENTASRLGGVHVERQPVGGGNVSELSFEIARRIEPLRIQREIKALGGWPERRLARNVETRRDADDRLSERQFLHAELLDEHLERQFGQDRLLRARVRRRGLRGKRAPQQLACARS